MQTMQKNRDGTLKGYTILQVLPRLDVGGVERGCVDMAQAIVSCGGRAIVASQGGQLVSVLKNKNIDHVTLPLASKNPFQMGINHYRLKRLIRDRQIDVVHARSRAPAWSAYWACIHSDKPFMTTFHSIYPFTNRLQKIYNTVMSLGERVIAISYFVADHIRTHYPHAADRIRVVQRGIDLSYFQPFTLSSARLMKMRQQYDLSSDRLLILVPGRLSHRKGQFDFLYALACLDHPNVHCLMVGPNGTTGRFRRKVQMLADQLGLSKCVSIYGSCDDMPALYALADVVVVPSKYEGFGRVAVEAQAMGRPVICHATSGLNEVVHDQHTGWLVSPGNPVALARCLDYVLRMTPEERSALSSRARAWVEKHFTTEQMTSATIDVYAELLAARTSTDRLS